MTALLRTEQLTCRFGGLIGVGNVGPLGRRRRRPRSHWAKRRRQDDILESDIRAYSADERRHLLGRRESRIKAAGATRRRGHSPHLPKSATVSRNDHHRKCDGRLARQYAQRCFSRRCFAPERSGMRKQKLPSAHGGARFCRLARCSEHNCGEPPLRSSTAARNRARLRGQTEIDFSR